MVGDGWGRRTGARQLWQPGRVASAGSGRGAIIKANRWGLSALAATTSPLNPFYTPHFTSLPPTPAPSSPLSPSSHRRSCPVPPSGPKAVSLPCSYHSASLMSVAASPTPSPFNPAASRPRVSSPLAMSAQSKPVSSRTHAFPTSRPLRPFPSLAAKPSNPARKPVKIIQPPANFKGAFVLNLTQAELSRQD
ncbi:hypothetical protein LXA43DRAFT_258971 [Ganoderma leucocontextum]|nr:hypothetical protein LXA43DRAFT_258971 [Ganoderma leucocontextum]